MSNFDRDILISNINTLMSNNGVTQKKLGEILGMSQPNVNHALNPNEKKCFTLIKCQDLMYKKYYIKMYN